MIGKPNTNSIISLTFKWKKNVNIWFVEFIKNIDLNNLTSYSNCFSKGYLV